MLAATTYTASAAPASQSPAATGSTVSSAEGVRHWREIVRRRRARTVRDARAVGYALRTGHAEMHTVSVPYLRWMARSWLVRDRVFLRIRARRFPALLCIHRYEGSWTAYNPAGPYYGGFQMDWSFMQAYGRDRLAKYGWRDARVWSPADQMAVASRAVGVRGYWPWPSSAAACGVL